MEYKNFSIDLFGDKYKVEFVKGWININNEQCYGFCDEANKLIQVTTEINNKSLSEEAIRIIIFHEIVHAIFAAGMYKHTNADEPLVEWTAKCLNQLYKKGVFK